MSSVIMSPNPMVPLSSSPSMKTSMRISPISMEMLADMEANKEEFYHFALRMSRQHQQHFAERPLAEPELQAFRETASASHEQQRAIEAADRISFASFLEQYFAQT